MVFIFYYIIFVLTYLITSSITFLLDFWLNYQRIINTPKMILFNVYKKVFPTVIFNLIVLSFFVFLTCSPLLNLLNFQFNFIKMIFDIICSIYMTDFFFFFSHRIMHSRYLYKWSHKVHHELKDPIGFGALYNHWFDYIFAGMLPAIYPQIILSSHYYTSIIWIILATTNVVFVSHGGFNIQDKYHYFHHKYFNCNYGIGLYMDKLCKTEIIK